MNKRCVALTDEQYRESISLLRSGFILDEKLIKPNERIAAVEVLQATLGLRLGDTLKTKNVFLYQRWFSLPLRHQRTEDWKNAYIYSSY